MSETPSEPENLLTSLLATPKPSEAAPPAAEPGASGDEDVDSLIDSLEALLAESRRMPFRKLLVDEDQLIAIVDRLRTAIPEEVRQAHQVLDQRDEILNTARSKARKLMEERGLMEAMENERQRMLDDAERDAQRVRGEADRYARNVLLDLEDRITKIQTSVRNGIETLNE
jgi:cell division septum initiation protein DivIVA